MRSKGLLMKNVSPFPKKFSIVKQHEKNEKPNQPQQLSFLKMIAAIVIGNGIVLIGLFCLFLLYLNMITFID